MWIRPVFLCLGLLLSTVVYAADKPGPFASSNTKLDYLLDTWKGSNLDELGTVWGRETSNQPRGEYQAYRYERTSQTRAGFSILSGQVSVSTDDIVCSATFEVDGEGMIVRVSRQGGGKECWNLFKRYEPPN